MMFLTTSAGWLSRFAAADSIANAKVLTSRAAIVSVIKAFVLFILSPLTN